MKAKKDTALEMLVRCFWGVLFGGLLAGAVVLTANPVPWALVGVLALVGLVSGWLVGPMVFSAFF
ncbi:MAG: hypothetical protein ACJAZ8_000724 [Planctomycetota bacterium]|jgi:hypothetical protein